MKDWYPTSWSVVIIVKEEQILVVQKFGKGVEHKWRAISKKNAQFSTVMKSTQFFWNFQDLEKW